MKRPRIMPPVYLLIAIVAMLALHFAWPGRQIVAGPWRWAGAVLIVAAVALVLWVAAIFRRHATTIKPGDTSSYLVTAGPFRFTRNPIYLGMTVLLAGVAIALGSATPWLVVPIFVVIISVKIIPVEEAILAEAFGPDYANYRAHVRRWI
ncbi:MAG: methyltransferase [Pirellulales bacterium]